MGKLVYFKWMVEDAKVLKENLTTEQIGELFVAVMDYLQTGTVVEVSKEIRFPYADYRNKVDRACASYDETCSKRAESGKKGGKAKAKNAARAAGAASDQAKKFKPPTLSQFKNAVKEIVEINDFDDVEPYDTEKFYDELRESSWNFEGMAIQARNDWEKIIYARFHDSMEYYHDGLKISYFNIVKAVIRGYPQYHNMWGKIDNIIDRLLDSWDGNRWKINGNSYTQYELKAALDALSEEQEEDEPP